MTKVANVAPKNTKAIGAKIKPRKPILMKPNLIHVTYI
jgi:hypothetical protein